MNRKKVDTSVYAKKKVVSSQSVSVNTKGRRKKRGSSEADERNQRQSADKSYNESAIKSNAMNAFFAAFSFC